MAVAVKVLSPSDRRIPSIPVLAEAIVAGVILFQFGVNVRHNPGVLSTPARARPHGADDGGTNRGGDVA